MNVEDAERQIARNGVWGTCVDCPRKDGQTFPERCKYFSRGDHQIPAKECERVRILQEAEYVQWLHRLDLYTRTAWHRCVLDCKEFPWRDWYDVGDTPAQAFGRAQQEREAVKATA